MKRTIRSVEDRFWEKVDKSGDCWEWKGSIHSAGYGSLWVGNSMRFAHRISWELANGEKVPANLFVLHHCDNRKCVNPSHLRAGTAMDNTKDRIAHGTRVLGEQNKTAKLTAEIVRSIRKEYRRVNKSEMKGKPRGFRFPHSACSIARKYGVSAKTVSHILNGDTWPHVDGMATGCKCSQWQARG